MTVPLLQFNLKDHNELFEMLQDFYFSRVIHQHVYLKVDNTFVIKKEKESDNFSCQKIDDNGGVHVDFAKHPQTFLKTVMHGYLSSQPLLYIHKME